MSEEEAGRVSSHRGGWAGVEEAGRVSSHQAAASIMASAEIKLPRRPHLKSNSRAVSAEHGMVIKGHGWVARVKLNWFTA